MAVAPSVDLDDPSETTFVIPYCEDSDDDWDESFEEDHDTGPDLRWKAYTLAWEQCLRRIQKIVRKLHEPVVKAISHEIEKAYSQTLPGLPHPELPVIAVSNPAGGTAFLDELRRKLDPEEGDAEPSMFTTHISPSQCPNLTMGMKALITGFTNRPPDKKRGRVLPASTSSASYDITSLDAWYTAVRTDRDRRRKPLPKLLVMLHDFERFDPSVMQDMLYICSLHVPQIPLVFVVSLLSPQSPTYLHVTYPRSTLAVLRIRQFSVPSGPRLLEEIILETFFSQHEQPETDDVPETEFMLGISALDFIADYFERFDSSTEGLIRLIKLAYLKHFINERLSLLCFETPDLHSSALPDILCTRLATEDEDISSWKPLTLSNKVVNARDAFADVAQKKQLGFGLMKVVYHFLGEREIRDPEVTLLGIARNLLTSKTVEVVKLAELIKKLAASDVSSLLSEVHEYMCDADSEDVEDMPALLKEEGSRNFVQKAKAASSKLADWLVDYMTECARPFEELVLWEVWCTGLTPYPMELVNPSLRSTLVSGLLRPHDFTSGPEPQSIAHHPDTSILFQRYLESGRMINVYDLFESFRGVLEMQRQAAKKTTRGRGSPRKVYGSPKKGKEHDKGKGKGKEGAVDKKEEATWQLKCQARFIRALHELDYMGFVKHTGRKQDHVMRTVFEIGDDE